MNMIFGMRIRIALICVTIAISACGSSPQVATPNATEMMIQAATGIAFVATADALTATATAPATATATAPAHATASVRPAAMATSTQASVATAMPVANVIATPSATSAPDAVESASATVTATASAVITPILPTVSVSTELTAIMSATATMTATATVTATVAVALAAFIDYTVVAGDNLLSIALRYHVSLATLMVQNDINNAALINEGQVLKIPNVPASGAENVFWTVYIVQPGETLLQIALQNDVTVDTW